MRTSKYLLICGTQDSGLSPLAAHANLLGEILKKEVLAWTLFTEILNIWSGWGHGTHSF